MPRIFKLIEKRIRMKRCTKCDKLYNTTCKFGKICDECKEPHWRVKKNE